MKRGGNFFSHFSGWNKKMGQLTFYSIFSGEGEYAGCYVFESPFEHLRWSSILWKELMQFSFFYLIMCDHFVSDCVIIEIEIIFPVMYLI